MSGRCASTGPAFFRSGQPKSHFMMVPVAIVFGGEVFPRPAECAR